LGRLVRSDGIARVWRTVLRFWVYLEGAIPPWLPDSCPDCT